jgi:SynChlorMet cassette radical SAM/SPASM protein ScmF
MVENSIQLPENVPPLNTYYIYLTGGCNLACSHCYLAPAYQPNGGTGGHLDYELFKNAIKEGIPLGLMGVKLTGGEPLLHPDFVRIVDFLKEKNIELTIETNGTLLTRDLAKHFKDRNALRFISVSLDGARSNTHDNFRGVKGSHERACQGIRNLVECGYHPQVIMSPYADNVQEIESLVLLAERLGASSVKFNPVQPTGRGDAMKRRGLLIDIQQLIQIGNWIEKDLQKKIGIPLIFGWPMAFRSINRLLGPDGKCNIFNILGILSSGHLAMCGIGAQESDLCYGKLGQDSIYDIWVRNEKILELRKKLPFELGGVCNNCVFKVNCMGYCVAGNYSASKSLLTAYWFCQGAFEQGLFPKSRLRTNNFHWQHANLCKEEL